MLQAPPSLNQQILYIFLSILTHSYFSLNIYISVSILYIPLKNNCISFAHCCLPTLSTQKCSYKYYLKEYSHLPNQLHGCNYFSLIRSFKRRYYVIFISGLAFSGKQDPRKYGLICKLYWQTLRTGNTCYHTWFHCEHHLAMIILT